MFLTRSIRRKLVIGLGLVCLMLGILALAGLTGLLSYSAVVEELEFRQDHEPHRTDLAVICATLFDPLLGERTKQGEQLLGFDAEKWSIQIERVREELSEFRRRVDRFPSAAF